MLEELLGETGGTIAQFGLSLIVVVALIFLVAWLVKRFGGSRFGGHQGDDAQLQVVDTLAVDSKRKLVLVRHGRLEHLLLIGGGSDEVIERSMVGGIPLAARMQASKAQDKQEDENAGRTSERFRTSNRFSSALRRSIYGEDSKPRSAAGMDTADAGTSAATSPPPIDSAAVGAAVGAVAASAAVSGKDAKATPAETPAPAKRADPPKTPLTTSAEPQTERDAIDKSLDEALSASLLDDVPAAKASEPTGDAPSDDTPTIEPAKPDPLKLESVRSEPKAPVTAKPPEPPSTPAAPPPTPAPTPAVAPAVAPSAPSMDDLDLERELEAALELDAFEATPAEGDRQPVDLPPLPDLPDLPDLSTLTGNGAGTDGGPAAPTAEEKPAGKAITDTPKPADQAEPLSGDASKTLDPDTPAPKADNPPTPDIPDIPVALSGRDDPPIPVTIPSRGPASSATTLAKSDEADEAPTAVDISAKLKPASTETPAADGAEKSDNLDDEMRRLLGEIAGGPEAK